MFVKFDILTIFPDAFSYLNESIVKRAQEAGLVEISVRNLRDWAVDKHNTTDDIPYGGGAGMVMKIEPIAGAIGELTDNSLQAAGFQYSEGTRVVLLSAKGKQFTQEMAKELSQEKHIIFIPGHYEGIDERVAKHIATDEVSIGPYVLSGGELPAMVMLDSIVRLIPGVLGNKESLESESFNSGDEKDYPAYTRPESFSPSDGIEWKVPDVLLSGHHEEIKKWREENRK